MTQPEGQLFDLGYQHYDGPREGRMRARKAVFADGFKTTLGLGRGASAKILPMLLFAAAMAPAVVLAANRRDLIGVCAVGLLLFAIPAASFGPNFAPLLLGVLLAGLVVAVGVVPLPARVRRWLRSWFGVASTDDRSLSPVAIECRAG